jgi:hypothetical protein
VPSRKDASMIQKRQCYISRVTNTGASYNVASWLSITMTQRMSAAELRFGMADDSHHSYGSNFSWSCFSVFWRPSLEMSVLSPCLGFGVALIGAVSGRRLSKHVLTVIAVTRIMYCITCRFDDDAVASARVRRVIKHLSFVH